MATKQPDWKCVGRLGDVDPIAYGGGFVYEDSTRVYPPEVVWFEPGDDEEYDHEPGKKGETKLRVYRFELDRNPEGEWWYVRIHEVTRDDETLQAYRDVIAAWNVVSKLGGQGGDPIPYAQLMADVGNYHGFENLDSYPAEMTEDEVYEKYAGELKQFR